MNVFYFADTRFPIERANGLQSMATCQALAAMGHDVRLVTRQDSASPARDPFAFYGLPETEGLRFDVIPASRSPRLRRLRFLVTAARRAIRARDAVIYTRDLGLASLLVALPTALRPRLVYESHGISAVVAAEMPALLGKPDLTPSARKLSRLDRQDRRVWRGADAYVAITSALADELAGRYGPRDEVFVVPDGASLDRPAAPRRAGLPVVAAYAGHLYPWKGVDVFVRALAAAPSVRGLIVGGHPAEEDLGRVRRLLTELGIEGRVEVTGLLQPTDVAARLAEATMLVLPNTASAISLRYTSPLKLFEYLTLSRPIIASDLPALREILSDGETALLVPPGDPAALAAAMTRVATDNDLAGRLAEGARNLAPAYTWDERARRLDAALDRAAAR